MSELRLTRARSGDLTASWESRQLHSRFDPIAEADRFVASFAGARAGTYVVIGPGLGYCIAALRRLSPAPRIVAISLDAELAEAAVIGAEASWRPDATESLPTFLERSIADLESASLELVEWRPVADTFDSVARTARNAVAERVRRAQASLVTRGGFGRRWLRNQFHNHRRIAPVRLTASPTRCAAVIVVAAGPSLEISLPAIARQRDRLGVVVTASALDATLRAGVQPDLVVVTDAAVYAAEHIRAAVAGSSRAAVAAPLATTRSLSSCASVAPFAETVTDRKLLASLLDAPISLPPHGTVTATAVALARAITTAPIVLVGADFAWYQGRSHARPHLSETYRDGASSRLRPAQGIVYASQLDHRSAGGGWTTDRTLGEYSAWLNTRATARFAPIAALSPSPCLTGVPAISEEEVRRLPVKHSAIAVASLCNPPSSRAGAARSLLDELAREARDATEPGRPADLDHTDGRFPDLAVAFALPSLLRWTRHAAAGERDSAALAWEETRRATLEEIRSIREILT